MNKLFAIILLIALALSATACTENDEPDRNGSFRPKVESVLPKGEPTEEELAQLREYANSVTILNQWVNGEIENIYYYDEETGEKCRGNADIKTDYASEVLKYHYNMIQNCEAVDKWAGTQWASDPSINWDREAVLDSFTILEDVALYELVTILDHVDNVNYEFVANRYYYNEQALLATVKYTDTPNALRDHSPFEMVESHPSQTFGGSHAFNIEYDENDWAVAMNVMGNTDDVISKITATHYDMCTIATLTEVEKSGDTKTAEYTYDSQHRVVEIRAAAGDNIKEQWVYTYAYDAKGNVTTGKLVYTSDNGRIEDKEVVTEEYSYTAEGILKSCEHTIEEYTNGKLLYETKDVYTYECDEQDRAVKATVVPGDKIEVATGNAVNWGKAEYARAEYVLVYGDYYSYNGK